MEPGFELDPKNPGLWLNFRTRVLEIKTREPGFFSFWNDLLSILLDFYPKFVERKMKA